MLDQGELPTRVSGPRSSTPTFGQLHQLLTGPVHQLGVGREGNVLRLYRGVDNDARVPRAIAPVRVATAGSPATALAAVPLPVRLRQFVIEERSSGSGAGKSRRSTGNTGSRSIARTPLRR